MEEHIGNKRAVQSDAAMKIILEASPVGIVVFDHDARVLYTNPLADTIFNTKPETVAKMKCGDFIRCVHRNTAVQGCGHTTKCRTCPLFSAICSTCSAKNDAKTIEGEAFLDRGPNLPDIWVKFKVVGMLIDGAKAAIMAVDDITTRKNDEEKLQNLMTELSAIHENAPIAMMLLDRDRKVIKANGFAARFANRTAAQMTGMTGGDALRCLHHLDNPKGCGFGPACTQCLIRQAVLNTFETGISQTEVSAWLPFPRGDAVEERCLQISTAFLQISGKERVLVCAQDITDRKRAQKALQESEEKFRKAFQTSPDAINLNQLEDGVYIDINDGFTKLMGYTRKDVMGKSSLALNIWANPEDRQRLVAELKEHGIVENMEAEFTNKNGQNKTALMSARILRINKKDLILSITRDITERKKAQKEKEKLQAQLTQAQKMESVGRLAGGVAHDFNNMLTVILGYTQGAMEEMDPSGWMHKNMQEVLNAAQRSADLTKQLLAFARKQVIDPKILNLNHTVKHMITMLQRLIGEDIDLLWQPCEKLWHVKMDPSQIDQILANLCVNGRDAISGVGKITIETGKKTFDQAYCDRNQGFIPGEFVMLAVSDNGCGMDQHTRNNLFEPFFTTKEVGKGTGLGLATIYGIVKQNSGFINVYSEPGQGTTFKIYLPRYLSPTDHQTVTQTPGHSPGGTETILVVEDETAILQMTRMMLEKLGYVVLPAATPGAAMNLAKNHQSPIHLLLTDVVMPQMHGRELAGKLAAFYPDMKFLFMSGYTANVIAHQGVLDQGVHFIQKPFSMKDLAVKVRNALD